MKKRDRTIVQTLQILNFYRFQCCIRFRQDNAELCARLVGAVQCQIAAVAPDQLLGNRKAQTRSTLAYATLERGKQMLLGALWQAGTGVRHSDFPMRVVFTGGDTYFTRFFGSNVQNVK